MLIDLSSTLSHMHIIAHRAAFMFGGELQDHESYREKVWLNGNK